ncbi:hypothetical protein RB195_009369 [Necator americanus]|uniref:Transmembrane protein n=1 Tax=Necator americanus TaxID=51031 RepID=A0ABR1CUN1_NECAM
MSMTDLQVEKQYSFCGLSLRCATQCCTCAQALICLVLGVLYGSLLEPTVILNILVGIHFVCAALALIFLGFCFIKRKFGSFYEVLLHAYLLSILLMGLTSLFAVMYLPLAFLQQSHSFGEDDIVASGGFALLHGVLGHSFSETSQCAARVESMHSSSIHSSPDLPIDSE